MSGVDFRERLAAILAADVESFSHLMALDEHATVAELDKAHAVFRQQIESRHGRVIDMAGDSVFAIFDTASGAVNAALAIQRELAAAADDATQHRHMRFRIGVHMGDVIERADGTVYGDGVNIAARLQGLAAPGGIAVSDSIQHAVKGRVGAGFEDLGEQVVKNIDDPVRVLLLVADQGLAASNEAGRPPLAVPDKPSLAVLPFGNLSGDPAQEYFADGIVDDIITALSRVREFFVIARSSSFTYKGKAVDVRRVGRELGVRYVVEGSIRRTDHHLRITADLVEAENGRHIWSDRFECSLDGLFELQDRIADSIAAAIEPNLRLAEIDRARSKPSNALQPYELCLRGLPGLQTVSDKAASDAATALFLHAVDLDPGYAYAKALCAMSYAVRLMQGWSTDAEVASGMRFAQDALASHHDDPTILSYAGFALSVLGRRHQEALHALARALVLNPNSTRGLACAGWVRCFVGDPGLAIEHFTRAMRLSPLDPEMGYMLSGLGFAHLVAGDLESALDAGLRSLQESPRLMSSHYLVTICLVSLGRMPEALAAGARLQQLDPGFALGRATTGLFRDPGGAFEARNRKALQAVAVRL